MRKKIFATTIVVFLTSLTSCNLFTSPEELEPGRRDYTWTADTIKVPEGYYTSLGYMWGSSPTDIWACGGAYVSDHTIWHYDGTSWENYDVERFMDPRGIYGFASDDIWLCTTNGEYWHYDGNEWSLHTKLIVEVYDLINQRMYGIAPDDIYAVGFADSHDDYYGLIVHYNGTDWKIVDLPKIQTSFQRFRYDRYQKKYIISSTGFDAGPRARVYEFDGTGITEIHKGYDLVNVGNLGDNIYVTIGQEIFRYNAGDLSLLQDFTYTDYWSNICGKSEKDFFTTNYNGIGHYNGFDIVTLYETDLTILEMLSFKNEMVFIGHGSYQTVIIHGKL